MSAFLTTTEHRNLIIKAYMERHEDPQEVDPDTLAMRLFVENKRSLNARYNDPLPTDEEMAEVTYTDPAPGRTVSDAGAAYLAACYSYQSCEHGEKFYASNVYRHVIKPMEDGDLLDDARTQDIPWGASEATIDKFLDPAPEVWMPEPWVPTHRHKVTRLLGRINMDDTLDRGEVVYGYVTTPEGDQWIDVSEWEPVKRLDLFVSEDDMEQILAGLRKRGMVMYEGGYPDVERSIEALVETLKACWQVSKVTS